MNTYLVLMAACIHHLEGEMPGWHSDMQSAADSFRIITSPLLWKTPNKPLSGCLHGSSCDCRNSSPHLPVLHPLLTDLTAVVNFLPTMQQCSPCCSHCGSSSGLPTSARASPSWSAVGFPACVCCTLLLFCHLSTSRDVHFKGPHPGWI